jgi:Kef-type K+ transport system membrane component KefB
MPEDMHELIADITLCILSAWVLGLLAHFSRQPLILAYLIAGFFIGPFGAGLVKSRESIGAISELGLIFMLFMIGLEIDLKKIVRAGRVILFAAGGQLIGGCLLGIIFFAGIGMSLGGGKFDALYLCVACALSSTVIIVKVLYEKRELDTLPGRITLGILVLQDIFAILFLAVQPSPGRSEGLGDPAVDRAGRRAGGGRLHAQPLRVAAPFPPHRAPA